MACSPSSVFCRSFLPDLFWRYKPFASINNLLFNRHSRSLHVPPFSKDSNRDWGQSQFDETNINSVNAAYAIYLVRLLSARRLQTILPLHERMRSKCANFFLPHKPNDICGSRIYLTSRGCLFLMKDST